MPVHYVPTVPGARVIADSISPAGDRLTTIEATIHRFVLAELNTHRAFSRNSASSRAIPVERQLARVQLDPAFPVSWPEEKAGMQGGAELPEHRQEVARMIWEAASRQAITAARSLADLGVHKSVTNRLLEPFMWHTVLISATEWANFLAQRCSPLAQPEIRQAAEAIRDAIEASAPAPVTHGEWHMPLIQPDELGIGQRPLPQLLKISAARCARVSYLTHDGQRSAEADLQLYARLMGAEPRHWSPLEHVATPRLQGAPEPIGNFDGWAQLRHHPAA